MCYTKVHVYKFLKFVPNLQKLTRDRNRFPVPFCNPAGVCDQIKKGGVIVANYYLNMSYGKVGKTNAHFDYITASGKYTGKEKEIVYEDHNMPDWVTSPKEFWDLADKNERVNGRTYREVRISLPEELTKEENIELLNQFLKENFSNHYYTVVIHDKETQPDFEYVEKHKNIHAHIMFCPRVIDDIERKNPGKYFKKYNSKHPERGGAMKDEKWNEVETLLKLRKDWEVLQNQHLEKHNINERVSCESLKKQRQKALEEGDLDKYEKLNREPINIDHVTLNKVNKNEYEKKKIEEFNLNREIRYYKDKAYDEILKERAKNKQIINEFNSDISQMQKETAFEELLAKRNKIDKNNSLIDELQSTNINNEVYSRLIPEYREKANELISLIKQRENLSDEEFNSLAQKYNELKLMEATIDKETFEKEKVKVTDDININIEKLKKENNKLNDEIKNIFSKNTNNKEFHSELEDYYKNNDSKKAINNIILANQEKEKIKRKIELIDLQLSNSRKTTLNILSKKKYVPLEKEINKLKEKLQSKENLGATEEAKLLKEIISKKEKELKDIEIRCTRDMDKFVRIKESFEKKLHNNREELNIKLKAIDKSIDKNTRELLLSNNEVRKHLSNVIENNNKLIELNNKKLEKLRFIKKTLNKDIKELEIIAYLSLTKGKYGKLQEDINKNVDKLEKIDIELIKLKENRLFNFLAIRKLEKEKADLEKEIEKSSKEFKELKDSISTEKLANEINRIKTNLNDKENKVDEQIQNLLNENKDLNSTNNICFNLFNQYERTESNNILDKSKNLFLGSGNTNTKNTGSWNIKIEDEKEKIIRL